MIKGNRIYLRAVETTDLDDCVRWVNDSEVTKYLAVGVFPISRLAEQHWIERAARGDSATDRLFAICTLDGDRHIGNAGLHGIDWISRRAELGIMIGEKDCWSQGYGTDVVRTLARFAFEDINLRRLYLRVFSHNPRGIRCYERCGFIEEGRLRAHHFVNGSYVDDIVMGLFAPELKSEL